MAHEQQDLRDRLRTLERRLRRTQVAALVMGVAAGGLILTGFQMQPTHQRFTEIDVERINVIEPDGRYAVVIANQERLPGGIMNGREISRRDGINGLIFYNSVGDEAGGLTFHSERNPDGSFRSAYGHLSLDRFESDQVASLTYRENGPTRSYGLQISDFPRSMIANMAPVMDSVMALPESERAQAMATLRQRWMEEGNWELQRLFVGQQNETALLEMRDTRGRLRVRLAVDSLDVARLEFLDEHEAVVQRLPER